MSKKPVEIYYLPKGELYKRLFSFAHKKAIQYSDSKGLKEDTIPMFQSISRNFDKEAREYFIAEDFIGKVVVPKELPPKDLIVDERIIVEVHGHPLRPTLYMGMEIHKYVEMTMSENYKDSEYIGNLHFKKNLENVFIETTD